MSRERLLERTIQAKVVSYLESLDNSFVMKIHGYRFQRVGVPDLLFLWNPGLSCPVSAFFEVKRPGTDQTQIQKHVSEEIRNAGCPVYVVRSVDDAKEAIEELIEASL